MAGSNTNRHKPYQGLKEMFTMYNCRMCGKDFIVRVPNSWVYKGHENGKKKMFCSYGCMRAFQRQKGEIE